MLHAKQTLTEAMKRPRYRDRKRVREDVQRDRQRGETEEETKEERQRTALEGIRPCRKNLGGVSDPPEQIYVWYQTSSESDLSLTLPREVRLSKALLPTLVNLCTRTGVSPPLS
jgi:hypothetical protein